MTPIGLSTIVACVCIAFFPVGIVLAWARTTMRSLVLAFAIPVFVAMAIYWLPEIGNPDKSDAREWASSLIFRLAVAGIAGSLLGLAVGRSHGRS